MIRVCPICGKEFTPKYRTRQKYCGINCKTESAKKYQTDYRTGRTNIYIESEKSRKKKHGSPWDKWEKETKDNPNLSYADFQKKELYG